MHCPDQRVAAKGWHGFFGIVSRSETQALRKSMPMGPAALTPNPAAPLETQTNDRTHHIKLGASEAEKRNALALRRTEVLGGAESQRTPSIRAYATRTSLSAG